MLLLAVGTPSGPPERRPAHGVRGRSPTSVGDDERPDRREGAARERVHSDHPVLLAEEPLRANVEQHHQGDAPEGRDPEHHLGGVDLQRRGRLFRRRGHGLTLGAGGAGEPVLHRDETIMWHSVAARFHIAPVR